MALHRWIDLEWYDCQTKIIYPLYLFLCSKEGRCTFVSAFVGYFNHQRYQFHSHVTCLNRMESKYHFTNLSCLLTICCPPLCLWLIECWYVWRLLKFQSNEGGVNIRRGGWNSLKHVQVDIKDLSRETLLFRRFVIIFTGIEWALRIMCSKQTVPLRN